jgi:hypothetical protein
MSCLLASSKHIGREHPRPLPFRSSIERTQVIKERLRKIQRGRSHRKVNIFTDGSLTLDP